MEYFQNCIREEKRLLYNIRFSVTAGSAAGDDKKARVRKKKKRKRSYLFDGVLVMDARDFSVPRGSAGCTSGTVVQSVFLSRDRHMMSLTSVRRKMWIRPISSRKTASRARNAVNSLRNTVINLLSDSHFGDVHIPLPTPIHRGLHSSTTHEIKKRP